MEGFPENPARACAAAGLHRHPRAAAAAEGAAGLRPHLGAARLEVQPDRAVGGEERDSRLRPNDDLKHCG